MAYGQWWLENCSQHSLKRMEADSLSSAAVQVKISGFMLKICSLRGAMCEFDEKTGFELILLNWS